MRLQVDGEATMLERLLAPDRTVVLLRDAPVYPEDPVECLARRKNLDRCVIDHATAFEAVEMDRTQELAPEIIVLDPRPVVCPSDPCPLVMDGRLMYRDQHHLTASYVKSLAPWLRDELLAALQEPEASTPPASPQASPSGAP